MRVVVIGGTGHIGSFLVPRLVRAGHEVVAITRGTSTAYTDGPEWQQVRQVVADRQEPGFEDTVAGLRPEVVVDLVCFTLESANALVQRLRGEVGHLLHCGSIWRHGPSDKLPMTESSGSPPLGEYGIQKARIARLLKEETDLVTTSLHPGHIVGPGWHPIGPLGNFDPAVWATLSAGQTLRIPGLGAESMHHVHADDVAQAFELAIDNRAAAAGEDFTITAPSALTVRGFVQIAAAWFGQEAVTESVTWEEFRAETPAEHADCSWEHLRRSHCFSIEKARSVLGYAPAYEPETAVLESVRHLIEHGELPMVATRVRPA